MQRDAFELSSYSTSKDYQRLADLARQSSVICIVDYKIGGFETIRDIARTHYSQSNGREIFQICALGTGYVYAFGVEEFIELCGFSDVEFIEPKI